MLQLTAAMIIQFNKQVIIPLHLTFPPPGLRWLAVFKEDTQEYTEIMQKI